MPINIEEEMAIYQFGQGVHSVVNMLEYFNQLSEDEKRKQYFNLYFLGRQLKPEAADIEQAASESSLGDTYTPNIMMNKLFSKIIQVHAPTDDIERDYIFMLHLFKIVYQRRLSAEKETPTSWRYSDLSTSQIAQDIVTKYRALVEQVYTDPSFRSEFISLAKLWHERGITAWAKPSNPDSGHQNQFNFFTYDEIVTVAVSTFDNKYARAISLLQHSLNKALLKQYGLDAEQINNVILDVIDQHMRETYNVGLFNK